MSNDGDPFRDDREAAHARTDALEQEVDRLERERDELKAKLAAAEGAKREDAKRARKDARRELERENAKRRASSDSESSSDGPSSPKNRLLGGAFAVGATVIVGLVVGVPMCHRSRDHERWIAASEQYARDTVRWDAYTAVGKCLRETRVALGRTARITPASMDPRGGGDRNVDVSSTLLPNCTSDVSALAQDVTLPQQARDAALAWSRAAADAQIANKPLAEYYQHADWKDDDYASGPAKWEPWIAARGRVATAVGIASDTLKPAVVKAIADVESTHPNGGEIWWKIEIGVRLDAMANAAVDGRATEVSAIATQLLADVKGAPLDIRRAVRETSDLEALARSGAVYDTPGTIDRANYRFWSSLQGDQAPFTSPGSAPEGACDGDGGGAV